MEYSEILRPNKNVGRTVQENPKMWNLMQRLATSCLSSKHSCPDIMQPLADRLVSLTFELTQLQYIVTEMYTHPHQNDGANIQRPSKTLT